MCGIAGKFLLDPSARVTAPEIEAMLQPIAHRGPDGHGMYLDANVGLGHRRLSIIDLAGGAQPQANEDGTVNVVFVGEIYNFEALRAGLIARGHVLRTRSDTEVIVHLYEESGPECVQQLDGMFTFALWDSRRQRLVLARDRVGIKPLYYAETREGLCFGSELKSILTDRDVARDLDWDALRSFLAFYYVPGEATLFRQVRKLLPAHYLVAEQGRITTHRYWDLAFTGSRYGQSFGDAVEELQALLGRTVRSHLMADVPVGVLLSGGVDSSTMLAFAAGASSRPVQTFTVGFDGPGMVDERPFARLAAQKFGAEHRELSITADDFWNFLPAYAWHMEEPVCEPPAVALYHVSRLARGHVKVLLSGEGGDEAFAGYPNYSHQLKLERLGRWLGPLSRPVGAGLALAGACLGNDRARRYGAALGRPLESFYFSRSSSPASYFNRRQHQLFAPGRATGNAAAAYIADLLAPVRDRGRLEQMLYVDTKTWLPDDLLVKADKMTMANSLELRVPLLDHHVLEFAASLPPHFKVQGRESKRVLKAACAQVLPAEILQRKKAGFPVPYDAWLRGPLAGRVRDTLLSSQAVSRGLFRPAAVEKILQAHARHGVQAKEIFSLLALEFWHQAFTDLPPAAPRPTRAAEPARAAPIRLQTA
jgi:asparagine synthase (glutamine-hydrolysing)